MTGTVGKEDTISGPELHLTGERTLPGIEVENYWFRRHEAAYLAAAERLTRCGLVLEAGVGEGYGARLLAAASNSVVGLDYDAATAAHAHRRYPEITVVRGNVVGLPFRTASFDAVVSMQVVEHLWDQPGYIAECARVLRPGGTLVISTPNRLTFSPGHAPEDGPPVNPFHTREFTAAELAELLRPHFPRITRYGLRHGPRLHAADRELRRRHGMDLIAAQLAAPAPQWHPEVRNLVGSVTSADFTLSQADLDTCLDLIFLSRPPGT